MIMTGIATDLKLKDAAPLIAAAQPKTPAGVKSIFKKILPWVPLIISGLLESANEKTKSYLRKTRDILNGAELGDS
jgi:hypothetical protein